MAWFQDRAVSRRNENMRAMYNHPASLSMVRFRGKTRLTAPRLQTSPPVRLADRIF